MPDISFTLPCLPEWPEGIYRIEVSDEVLGYDPKSGNDGVANLQWLQLGNRTLYLKKLYEANHVNGVHVIRNENLTDETKIPERKLNLIISTENLDLFLDELDARLSGLWLDTYALSALDENHTAILAKLIPWCDAYFKRRVDYVLFGEENLTRNYACSRVTDAIAGDDSLDVVNTEGFVEGQSYFLFDEDGENVEEVKVRAVLTKTRLRVIDVLGKTRTSGWLSSVSVVPGSDAAYVKSKLTYVSGDVSTLKDSDYGILYIHRDDATTYGHVYWSIDGEKWKIAEFRGISQFPDGTVDDVYYIPAYDSIRFKVTYPATDTPWKIYYFALRGRDNIVLPDVVRQPEIKKATKSGGKVTIDTTSFASLWNFSPANIKIRLRGRNDYEPVQIKTAPYREDVTFVLNKTAASIEPLYAQVQHIDENNDASRWSRSVTVLEK